MAIYRKKPVEVRAIRVCDALKLAKDDWYGLPDWLRKAYDDPRPGYGVLFEDDCISVTTLEGTMIAGRDDWLICGVKGEIYPCRSDIFAETYEFVGDQAEGI